MTCLHELRLPLPLVHEALSGVCVCEGEVHASALAWHSQRNMRHVVPEAGHSAHHVGERGGALLVARLRGARKVLDGLGGAARARWTIQAGGWRGHAHVHAIPTSAMHPRLRRCRRAAPLPPPPRARQRHRLSGSPPACAHHRALGWCRQQCQLLKRDGARPQEVAVKLMCAGASWARRQAHNRRRCATAWRPTSAEQSSVEGLQSASWGSMCWRWGLKARSGCLPRSWRRRSACKGRLRYHLICHQKTGRGRANTMHAIRWPLLGADRDHLCAARHCRFFTYPFHGECHRASRRRVCPAPRRRLLLIIGSWPSFESFLLRSQATTNTTFRVTHQATSHTASILLTASHWRPPLLHAAVLPAVIAAVKASYLALYLGSGLESSS